MTTHQPQRKDSSSEAVRKSQTGERPSQAHDVAQIPSELALQQAIDNPNRATPKDILGLQSVYGNRAVSGLIQTKLRVGPVGDTYEQEADHIADQVMRMPAPNTATPVQRQAMPEDEELLQGKPLAATITPVVQRQAMPEDEELLQGKSMVQRQEDEELLQGKPLVQRQGLEDEELLQGKSLVQRQEDEELLQGKPLVQRQEDEELLQGKSLVQRQEPDEEELLQGKSLVQRQEPDEEELLQGKPIVQRQGLEDEELLQGKSLAQRQELEEEDLQLKPMVQRQSHGGFQANDDVERRIAASRGSGSPLPDHLRADMEARFGNDFGAVRVHTGGEAEQLNRTLSARAFTHGSDIYLGSSQYNPDSTEGQRLLAHELTHVVQQTGHRARTERSTPTGTPSHTAQRASIIQRAVTDSKWTDLLPKEKQTLTKSGFFNDAGLELQLSGSDVARNWDALNANERSAYYGKAQAKGSLTGGATFEGGILFGKLEEDERNALRTIRSTINYTNRTRIKAKLSIKIVSRVQAYNKLSEAQKKALVENYGISNPTEYAQIPDSRVTEIHKLLEEAKTQEGKEKEEGLRKTEQEGLTKKPGFGEMVGEGWRGFGTLLKRGTRSILGLGMSSGTAKRKVYARRRQNILRARLERGEMPTRQRPLRARPAPKSSGPSSEDIKNIMIAVRAIQSSDIGNKNEIVTALLAKAGMG